MKGQIFGTATLKNKLSEEKIRKRSAKKVLPNDIKIVYYGPIGKIKTTTIKEKHIYETPKKY